MTHVIPPGFVSAKAKAAQVRAVASRLINKAERQELLAAALKGVRVPLDLAEHISRMGMPRAIMAIATEWAKGCKKRAEHGRAWREANPGRTAEYQRNRSPRRRDNRVGPLAEITGRADAHRRDARERMRVYRAANPELAREQARKWQKEHPDKARARARAWYAANKERLRAKALAKYYANPKARVRARERARVLASQRNLLSVLSAAASVGAAT